MSAGLVLLLLRHAPAEAGTSDGDAARPLSPRGIAEADAAAAWLAGQAAPARALCSPALRTRQTLERVVARCGPIDTRIEDAIYEATPGDLLDVIDAHRDAGCLLLVGHNPGLESVVALLTTGQSGDHRGMPPAGLAILQLPDGAAIEPGVAQLTAFWSP